MTTSKLSLPISLILAALLVLLSSNTGYAAGPTCTVGDPGYPTIQDAVDDLTCTTIVLPADTYFENVVIDHDLSIEGAGADMTIVNGGGVGIVFRIQASTVLLSDLTITNGSNDVDSGGGISALSSNLTVRNSTIHSNSAVAGGGIGTNLSKVLISNSTVSSNTAFYGGGIDNNTDGSLAVENSAIISNTAFRPGGGVADGGGIHNNSGNVTVNNSTIGGNSATDGGGGIVNFATLTVIHSTISDNNATDAGGIANYNQGVFTMTSSIIANSLAGGDCINSTFPVTATSLIDGGYNLVEDGSCFSGGTNLSGDPKLAELAHNRGSTPTYALLADSPAANAMPSGVNGCGTTWNSDQRGFTRPASGMCDIGAFEAQPPITGLSAISDGPTVVNNPTLLTAIITGGGSVAYDWDFGDESIGTGITSTHTYTQTGIYTATVVADNVTNSMTATTTVYVGDAVVSVNNNSFSPKEVSIPISGTVVWVLRSGSHSVTADDDSFEQPAGTDWTPFVHTFGGDDTVPYHCSVHGAPGGVGMAGTVIVGNGVPTLTGLTAINDGPTVLGHATTFDAEFTGGTPDTYAWDFGDGNDGSGITTTHTYIASGVYTATVVATNETNSVTATTTVYVGDAVVEVFNNFYSPAEVTIPAGGKVVWVLRGGNHSVTADDLSFEQPAGTNWPPFIHTFNVTNRAASDGAAATTIAYHCSVHGQSMAGTVIVGTDAVPSGAELLLPNVVKE